MKSYSNFSSKNFNTYNKSNFTSLDDERQHALNLAKNIHKKQVEKIKESAEYIKRQKDLDEMRKKAELEKKKEEEYIKNINNKDIKKSLKIAEKENKKLINKVNQDTPLDDLLNTILPDLKKKN